LGDAGRGPASLGRARRLATLAATAARIQLIVLLPAALTAVLLVAAAGKGRGPAHRLAQAVKAHRLLFGVAGGAVLAAAIRGLAGGDVSSAFGRYSNVWQVGLPDPDHVLLLALHHVAGLDLAVGVIPFAGALVAAFGFVIAGFPRRYLAFAAVGTSFTAWLIVEVAVDADLFERPGAGIPTIHERFLIYAVPLLIVAAVASVRSRRSSRLVYVAAGLAAVLPALIPFDTYVHRGNVVDTFALLPFGRPMGEAVVAVPSAPVLALLASSALALIYAKFGRRSLRSAAAVLAALSALVWINVEKSSSTSRATLPASPDWVDDSTPTDGVILITSGQEDAMPARQTAFHNRSITRVYALCWRVFGGDADERQLSIDRSGTLQDSGQPLLASYAVVPADLRIRGRVVARNAQGGQILVRPTNGRVTLPIGAEVPGCTGP
jgi:hypothetical protein